MSEQETVSAGGGWQPDPTGRHELRYWDGTAWTDQVSDQGTASTDPLNASAPAVAPGYAPAAAGGRGQIGKPSPVGMTILLTIVTLGIYGIIWLYRQQEELKRYSGEGIGGVLAVVIALVFGIASPFILANEVQKNYEREGQQSPIKTVEGLWVLIPLIGMLIFYLKVQKAITDFWVARGATPV
jgi:hypothetical protein